MILVDANVVYAIIDRTDTHHRRIAAWFEQCTDELLMPATVIAETCYHLDKYLGPTAEALFLRSLVAGPEQDFRVVDLVDADLRRMAELVSQYADLRLGGTDASLVALAERLNITTIATLDERDFRPIVPLHAPALRLMRDIWTPA